MPIAKLAQALIRIYVLHASLDIYSITTSVYQHAPLEHFNKGQHANNVVLIVSLVLEQLLLAHHVRRLVLLLFYQQQTVV